MGCYNTPNKDINSLKKLHMTALYNESLNPDFKYYITETELECMC